MAKISQKELVVNEIKDKLLKAKSIVLIDARGLSVSDDTNLRKQLRDAGVDYKVYKNTLTTLAVKGTEFEGIAEYLKGPSAIAFSYDDATLGARIINKNLKSMKALEFKAGIIEGIVYNAETIAEVANIPSKEELYSKLLGSFKNPMASFARLIKAISDEKVKTETV